MKIITLSRINSENKGVKMSYKSSNYTDLTWDYISTQGSRKDPIKDSLESETYEKFPSDAEMMTNRQECLLFELILKFANARNCIEVGVFTGSSALSIARGLAEGGKLYALDVSEEFTGLAKKYWEEGGVSDKIELIIGPANQTLNRFIEEGKEGTFDFAYVDADKTGYCEYFELLVRLVRPGGLIAFDNAFRRGMVADLTNTDESNVGIRELNRIAHSDPRVCNVILPIADGVNLIRKL